MRFAEPIYFLLIISVIIIGAIMFWAISRKKMLITKFGDLPLIIRNAPYISFARQRTKATLIVIALLFLVISMARLQFGTHTEVLKREGLDIVIALDVSYSMLAQDMKPNRLEKAKQEIRGVIERLRGDRIAIVPFAGEAFTLCPLTLDYAAATFLLNSIDQSTVSVPGTSLNFALERAIETFNKKEKKHKVLIFLTDGEDHTEGVIQTSKLAKDEGIKIYSIGIGNPDGEPIPILDRGGNQVGFRKDENGQVVISKLDEKTLREISQNTGGKYYHATAGEIELDKIFSEIEELDKKELEGTIVTKFDDRFQIPMFFALFFLLVEFFVSERKLRTEKVDGV